VDFFRLSQDIGVGPVKIDIEAVHAALHGKMVGVDGAQQKRAEFFRAAKFEKVARVRQFDHRTLRLL
jgi:hypothetical protein